MALPGLIPIFPLPNAVLFPGVPLPLHVFEPRYRQMVRDVRDREEAFIGMVLLRGDWRTEYYGNPEVYPTGCAGRVVRVEELSDGRYNILLNGLREFEVDGEDRSRPYRQAHVRWRSPTGSPPAPGMRSRLRELTGRLLAQRKPELAPHLLSDDAVSDELFVNLLCFALDFSPVEKQALLEAASPAERAARLCDVMHFALEAGAGPDIGRYH